MGWILCCNRMHIMYCQRQCAGAMQYNNGGKTSSHELSGNATCILYHKAFQGIWLKTILQWGMPSFCFWNKLRLLTKWLPFWCPWFEVILHPTLMEFHPYWHWLWGGFLPVETVSGSHCDFPLLHFSCIFPLILIRNLISSLTSSEWKFKTSVHFEEGHRLYVYVV